MKLVRLQESLNLINNIDRYDSQYTGMINKYVIVRSYASGVHFGKLIYQNKKEAVLKESRRLWYWTPAEGAWLSSVSQHGIDYEESKIGESITIHVTDTCEIILCSETAIKSIKGAKDYEPN